MFLNFTGLSANSHCSHVDITDYRKLKVQSWVDCNDVGFKPHSGKIRLLV